MKLVSRVWAVLLALISFGAVNGHTSARTTDASGDGYDARPAVPPASQLHPTPSSTAAGRSERIAQSTYTVPIPPPPAPPPPAPPPPAPPPPAPPPPMPPPPRIPPVPLPPGSPNWDGR
jgi:hypothetical protein